MSKILLAFKNRRIAVVMLLGFSSGLPLPLVWGTLKGWMTDQGVSLRTVGLFSLVTLPYALKFLWAPLLDRYSLPFLGRRTGWMAVAQVSLIGMIAFLGSCNPHTQISLLATCALIVALLSATQDIAIDAYRTELLLPEELGPGAAVAVTGARIGLLTGGSLAFILADHMPWSRVYAIMACLMLVGLITALFAPTPMGEPRPPRTLGAAIIHPFKVFFDKPRAVEILIFILIFTLGDVVAGEMLTPFLLKIGFSKTAIGVLNKGFGMSISILGTLIGGAAVVRMGIWRSLLLFICLQPFSNLLFAWLAHLGANYPMLVIAIGTQNLCTGMWSCAYVAFLMSLCDRRYTATQYALLSSLMALTRPFVGGMTGFLAVDLGWVGYYVLSAVLAIPGILMLLRFRNYRFEVAVAA